MGGDLSGSRLQGADFSDAFLHRTCLRGIVAAGSHWVEARLVEADFRSGLDQLTDLRHADLRGCDLRDCSLDGTLMENAQCDGERFKRCNEERTF